MKIVFRLVKLRDEVKDDSACFVACDYLDQQYDEL